MRIEFRKILAEGLSFSLEKEQVTFSAKVEKRTSNLLLCEGKMEGVMTHHCDRCGDALEIRVDEVVSVLISDQELHSSEDELPNGIEFFDGYADFSEVFNSELEAYKSDYFYCLKCQDI
ncbi:MAG: hypothetical protein GX780_08180 [Campylobacteraceae bacterium]|nr:hypothetical protein [Campylobacteraceae bacterium]